MKYLVIAFLIFIQSIGFSQSVSSSYSFKVDTFLTEISLSDTVDTSSRDFWEIGDYKIYVERQPLLDHLMKYHLSFDRYPKTQRTMDSLEVWRYQTRANRYLAAYKQLEEMPPGSDLRQLDLYLGFDNKALFKGNSVTIETYVRQHVEVGNAMVYYKGNRVSKLKKLTEADIVMSIIKLYYDDPGNFVLSYYGYINW